VKTTPRQGHANVKTHHVNGDLAIADAHHRDGKRFIVRADELLTAFVELESAIRAEGSV
jgi:hypothetical protein